MQLDEVIILPKHYFGKHDDHDKIIQSVIINRYNRMGNFLHIVTLMLRIAHCLGYISHMTAQRLAVLSLPVVQWLASKPLYWKVGGIGPNRHPQYVTCAS
jgi:hypothetical protein